MNKKISTTLKTTNTSLYSTNTFLNAIQPLLPVPLRSSFHRKDDLYTYGIYRGVSNMISEHLQTYRTINSSTQKFFLNNTGLAGLFDSLSIYQKAFKATSLIRQTAVQFNIPPMSYLADEIAKYTVLSDSFKEKLSTSISLSQTLMEQSQMFHELYHHINFDEVILNEDGSILIADEIFSKEQVRLATREFFEENSGLQTPRSIESILKICVELLRKLILYLPKKDQLTVIILTLFLNFVSSNVIDPLWEKISGDISRNTNEKQYAKYIKKEVARQPEETRNVLKPYRFVNTTELNLREGPTKKSRIMGSLSLGELVRVIKKKNDWTLIEWKSQDEELVIQGWVYTRYLSKFE
ncbi:hypothetical protein AM501_05360 [Aneurinibacillus migulanus]|uniref:SH3 domain-containing protein n=1 Tax=Aneurinibacillus migulanus TaxID=47500 RepID=UPI0005B7D7F3|nr:SH3 domain-containing protein [Aneurinibacillus migulanus]KIV58565.1 hypothetical protein TS64_04255 [Aneurinibacillus migulanus]KPD09263.1 hypothetical protein AM501_05360 [Aneurinibacillus migulanus]